MVGKACSSSTGEENVNWDQSHPPLWSEFEVRTFLKSQLKPTIKGEGVEKEEEEKEKEGERGRR